MILLKNKKWQQLASLCLSIVAASDISGVIFFACTSEYVSGSTERRRHIKEEAQIRGCKDRGSVSVSTIQASSVWCTSELEGSKIKILVIDAHCRLRRRWSTMTFRRSCAGICDILTAR